jgi:CO/xanthine dehydrogenase Mo-binding subunit
MSGSARSATGRSSATATRAPRSRPGVKGLGELGNVGTAAAVANAVYPATGKRMRNLPIRIEDLL